MSDDTGVDHAEYTDGRTDGRTDGWRKRNNLQ